MSLELEIVVKRVVLVFPSFALLFDQQGYCLFKTLLLQKHVTVEAGCWAHLWHT